MRVGAERRDELLCLHGQGSAGILILFLFAAIAGASHAFVPVLATSASSAVVVVPAAAAAAMIFVGGSCVLWEEVAHEEVGSVVHESAH